MSQPGEGGGLRSILLGLYHQLANEITALRIKTYQPAQRGAASVDLVDRLHGYISSTPPEDANLSASIHTNKVSMVTQLKSTSYEDTPVVKSVPSGLSESLNERHATRILRNTAGNKLIQSIWDHLHSSIRSAKAGDAKTARLHASIMDNALKEAANYVSKTEYQELVQSLDKEFSGMTRSPIQKADPDGI